MRGWGRGRKPPFWVYLRSAFRRGRETLEGVSRTVVESPKSGEGCRGKMGGKCNSKRLHPAVRPSSWARKALHSLGGQGGLSLIGTVPAAQQLRRE